MSSSNREILTDCDSAWDKESFVLRKGVSARCMKEDESHEHEGGTFAQSNDVVVYSVLRAVSTRRMPQLSRDVPRVIRIVEIQILHLDILHIELLILEFPPGTRNQTSCCHTRRNMLTN